MEKQSSCNINSDANSIACRAAVLGCQSCISPSKNELSIYDTIISIKTYTRIDENRTKTTKKNTNSKKRQRQRRAHKNAFSRAKHRQVINLPFSLSTDDVDVFDALVVSYFFLFFIRFLFRFFFGLIWCAQWSVLYQRSQSVLTVTRFGVCVCAFVYWFRVNVNERVCAWFSRFVHDQSHLWVSGFGALQYTHIRMSNAYFFFIFPCMVYRRATILATHHKY